MGNKICCICHSHIDTEDANLLTIGGYGTPRYLCETCNSEIETATMGRDYDEIVASMDSIVAKMSEKAVDDHVTTECVNGLFEDSAKRAAEIKEGTYDFAVEDAFDEVIGDSFDEIPEELLESEEDRALDEKEEAEAKKINKVLDYVWLAAIIGIVGFAIWFLFFR